MRINVALNMLDATGAETAHAIEASLAGWFALVAIAFVVTVIFSGVLAWRNSARH